MAWSQIVLSILGQALAPASADQAKNPPTTLQETVLTFGALEDQAVTWRTVRSAPRKSPSAPSEALLEIPSIGDQRAMLALAGVPP